MLMKYVVEALLVLEHMVIGCLVGIFLGYMFFEYMNPDLLKPVYCIGSYLP